MNEKLKELSERYERLNPAEKQNFQKAYKYENSSFAESPASFGFFQDVSEFENQAEKGDFMEKGIKTPKTEENKPEHKPDGKELAKINRSLISKDRTFEEDVKLCEMLYNSRYFKDLESVAQAFAKIQAGKELGFGPFYSLSKLYVIPGKPPAIEGQAMAGLVRNKKYLFKISKEIKSKEYEITFYYPDGKEIGKSSFNLAEAQQAGLLGKDSWRKYTDDLLYWRAFSRGARRFCPDAIMGSYTYEEMGLEVDSEGKVIETVPIEQIQVEVPELPKPDSNKQEEVTKPSLSKEQRLEILEKLEKEFGRRTLKQVKEEMKLEGRVLDFSDEDFNKFCEGVEDIK